jgi:ribose-phosphate pyrophosphokinase
MSALEMVGRKTLVLISGRGHPEFASRVAAEIGQPLMSTTARTFANGEVFIKPNDSVRGADVFVLQSFAPPINEWVVESLILVDALKRASAKRITLVFPFYPYARQDKKHRGREPVTARLMSDLYRTAGANRLMTLDLHAAQIQGFFDGPVDHLFAMPLLAEYVAKTYVEHPLTIVSPDTGRVRMAEQWADELGGCPIAFVHKSRNPDVANQVVANRVVGEVAGRTCIMVDDMIDTGGTIVKASELLLANGASTVVVAATHAVFSPPAVERLLASGIREVVVTDSLPLPNNARFDKLTVLSIAPVLAKAIWEAFADGSVTGLFRGPGGIV